MYIFWVVVWLVRFWVVVMIVVVVGCDRYVMFVCVFLWLGERKEEGEREMVGVKKSVWWGIIC